MSIGCRAAAAAMADLTEAWSATSATAANCAAPDATASSSVARLRPSTVTVAPACDSAADIARPMPRPPPVTSAWEERDRWDMSGPPADERFSIYFKLQAFARKRLRSHERSDIRDGVGYRCAHADYDAVVPANAGTRNRWRLLWRTVATPTASSRTAARMVPAFAGTTEEFRIPIFKEQPHVRDLAALFARGLHFVSPPRKQRAQGRPGARCTRGLVCKVRTENAHTSIQVQREHPAFPAQWLYGLLRALVSAKSARMCERAVLTNRPSLDLIPFVLKGREPVGERGTDPVSSSTRTVARASSPNRARKGVDDGTK